MEHVQLAEVVVVAAHKGWPWHEKLPIGPQGHSQPSPELAKSAQLTKWP